MPVYDKAGKLLITKHIESQLWKCINNSEKVNEYPINVVSSDNRDKWAAVYKRLKQNGN